MDIIIVGIIVAAAVFVTLRNFLKTFKSGGGCSCDSGSGCASNKSCSGEFPIAPKKL